MPADKHPLCAMLELCLYHNSDSLAGAFFSRDGVVVDPRTEFVVAGCSGRGLPDHGVALGVRCREVIVVEIEEKLHQHQRHPLVAIDEWMTPNDAEPVRGRERRYIRLRLGVRGQMLRPSKG